MGLALTSRAFLRVRTAALPAILLVALWLPGVNQGWYRTDSSLYAAISRYAWETGSLWRLHLGDQPYFNKPPLVFWIEGWFLHTFGTAMWAGRLPSLLAGLGCVLVSVHLARRLSGPKVALLTGVALATTLEFFRYTRAVSLELWLTLFILLGTLGVVTGVRRARAWPIILAGVPFGLALLCKPLVAMLPIGVLALWIVLSGRLRPLGWLILSAIVALAIAAPWHISMAAAFGPAFIDEYFGRQVVQRALTNKLGSEPWWYYLRGLASTYWPWLITTILGVAALAARARRRACPPGATGGSSASGLDRHDRATALLAALWCGAWLIGLSAFSDKNHRYLIPAFPFLAWFSAMWLVRYAPPNLRRGGRAWMNLLGPAALLISLALALSPLRVHAPRSAQWNDAAAFVVASPDTQFFTTRASSTDAAVLYLATGRWPRTLSDPPPPGAIVFTNNSDPLVSEPGVQTVHTAGRLRFIRLNPHQEPPSAAPLPGASAKPER